MRAPASCTEYTGALLGKALKQVLSRLASKFVIAKAYSNGSTRKIKSIHLLEGFFRCGRVAVPTGMISIWKFIGDYYLLHKTIALTASLLFFLELNKLKLTERLEDISEVVLCDREMYVADV